MMLIVGVMRHIRQILITVRGPVTVPCPRLSLQIVVKPGTMFQLPPRRSMLSPPRPSRTKRAVSFRSVSVVEVTARLGIFFIPNRAGKTTMLRYSNARSEPWSLVDLSVSRTSSGVVTRLFMNFRCYRYSTAFSISYFRVTMMSAIICCC